VPFKLHSESRKQVLERLSGALERETIHFPNVPKLVRQLRAMQLRRLTGGAHRLDVPSGEHDDEVFALALALTECGPPPAVEARRVRRTRGPYVPTQAQVDGTASYESDTTRRRRRALSDKMRDRADKLGIEY
jgi:hypothetical protein